MPSSPPNSRSIRNLAREIIGASKIARAVTEHRRIAQQVTRERDTAQRYLDVAGVMILVLDVAGNVTLINRQGCNILGYDDPKYIIGRSWIDSFIPEHMREEMTISFRRLVSGEVKGLEFYNNSVLTRTGEERIIDWHNSVLTNERGVISATLSSGEDVTDRQRAECSLRLSEARFRSIFGAVSEGIFIIDAQTGRFAEINEPGLSMLGYAADELIGREIETISSGIPPYTQLEAAQWIEKAASTGRTQRFDWHCKTKESSLFWAEISLRFDSISGPGNVIAIVRDMTNSRALEAQLRQSQKMEALGQLTGGVAHDFNNLLAIMHGNLELLEDHIGADPQAANMINDALDAAKRGASLTHRLLAFSRQQQLAPSSVDVGEAVASLISVLRRVVEEHVQIATLIAPDVWRCMIDARELENAILNLALNARDAMPDGGILTIKVENAFVEEEADQNTEANGVGYVVISVTDTGVGMPKDVVDRALDPFFTTKPVGKGTGLGLPMVYGFVRRSGGHLEIHSEPGQGTRVNLYLPRFNSGPTGASLERKIAAPVAEAQTVVLVVEDDPALRKVQLRVLSSLRYQTLEAADGVSGLEILASDARVDLLMTDIVLPGGMSGPALVDAARRVRPDLKVIFVSGYAPPEVRLRHNQTGACVLSKPFTQAELAHALRAALG